MSISGVAEQFPPLASKNVGASVTIPTAPSTAWLMARRTSPTSTRHVTPPLGPGTPASSSLSCSHSHPGEQPCPSVMLGFACPEHREHLIAARLLLERDRGRDDPAP
ncbi:MAG: hypothetical protein ACRDRK_23155 [Pseudonocardia sp.]